MLPQSADSPQHLMGTACTASQSLLTDFITASKQQLQHFVRNKPERWWSPTRGGTRNQNSPAGRHPRLHHP